MSVDRHVARAALLVVCCLAWAGAAQAENWPRFRGPAGTGVSTEKNVPVEWTSKDIAWRTQLPGEGQSSPVIWGGKIFLTSAEAAGDTVKRYVICVNRLDGKILWQQLAHTGPGESLHKMNTFASATCATDGEHVIAFFGIGGLHCYDLEGKRLWSKDLGQFAGPWGVAASPVIVGDLVIQNCDADEDAYLAAFNIKTGEQVWKTDRHDIRGWSTPIVIEAGGRTELVMNGDKGVQSYNPQTGEEYWFCKSFIGRGSPMPAVSSNGLLVVVNGKPGPIYAIKPGGSGDVTATHMAWNTDRRGGRDLPSPIAVGDYVFVVNMQGIGSLYDPKTGKELWKERLGGNYSAAPLVAGGLIYQSNEEGETVVIRPGAKLDIVARNPLPTDGDLLRASLVPCDGQMFVRSNSALYCIGKQSAE